MSLNLKKGCSSRARNKHRKFVRKAMAPALLGLGLLLLAAGGKDAHRASGFQHMHLSEHSCIPSGGFRVCVLVAGSRSLSGFAFSDHPRRTESSWRQEF